MTKKNKRALARVASPATSTVTPLSTPTSGPDAWRESTTPSWDHGDATSFTPIDDEGEAAVATGAALAAGFFSGRSRITVGSVMIVVVVAWALLVGWLFIQDNAAGRLETATGLVWFAKKAVASAVPTVLVGLALSAIAWLRGKMLPRSS